jgi:hypothetical protein
MDYATIPHSHEDHLAPLVGLVDRLRAQAMELQGPWEALGEELEDKRGRLTLAEATVDLIEGGVEETKEAAPASQDMQEEGLAGVRHCVPGGRRRACRRPRWRSCKGAGRR